jgi:hypothetical protein
MHLPRKNIPEWVQHAIVIAAIATAAAVIFTFY